MKKPGILRRMYDWTVDWAKTPYGEWALFVLAFAESSFFPIPPDVLLIALAVALPRKSFRYAAFCSVGSVLGGAFGYFIGWQFMDLIGMRVVHLYGLEAGFADLKEKYALYNAWVVAVAGFTPIPYKLATITAGACAVNFPVFMLASVLSRSARFFLAAGFIRVFGPKVQPLIEKYFDALALAFTVLLIAGFVVIKYVL